MRLESLRESVEKQKSKRYSSRWEAENLFVTKNAREPYVIVTPWDLHLHFSHMSKAAELAGDLKTTLEHQSNSNLILNIGWYIDGLGKVGGTNLTDEFIYETFLSGLKSLFPTEINEIASKKREGLKVKTAS